MKAVRVLSVLALLGLLSSCSDPAEPGGAPPGFARVAVRAVAPPSLSRFAPALIVEQVQINLLRFTQRETTDTVATRLAAFPETSNQLNLSLNVAVPGVDTLYLTLDYLTADGTVLFSAGDYVIVGPGRTANPPALVPFYVGPGSNIAFMSMNGDDTTVTAGSDVQLDVTAFDSAQGEVTSFYLTWTTSDPRVTVSPRGLVHTAPNITMQVRIFATTPTGVQASNLMFVQGAAAFALSPDSVELRPSGTQFFQVTIGPDVTWEWTSGGIVGGDSAHGFISDGFYTAPPTPLPGDETLVCVQNAQNSAEKGCAKVRVPAIPTVGADVVVINDQNIFDSIPMKRAGNIRFVKNLVSFAGSGPRSNGKTVWYDRGRNSPCMVIGDFGQECGDGEKGRFNKVIEGQGFKIVRFDSYTPITTIPIDVKVIIMWMPLIPYDFNELSVLLRFASEGGRIVFIGENAGFYSDGTTEGVDLENAFLRDLGSTMSNVGDFIDCIETDGDPYPVSGPNSLRTHPLTTGVSNLSYACASQITIGANDIPFFYDIANQLVLGAVAKINVSPPNGGPIVRPVPVAASQARPGSRTTRSGSGARK